MIRVTRWAPLAAALMTGAGAVIACGDFAEGSPEAVVDDDGGPSVEASAPEGDPPPECTAAQRDSDPAHCGRCGHSCLGGACVGGTCQPLVVSTTVGEPVLDVAVDANRVLWLTSNVFWAGPGHVYGCPKSGCTTASSLAVEGVFTGNLAAGDTAAFASFVYGTRAIKRVLPAGTLTDLGTSDHASAVRLTERDGHLLFLSLYEPTAFGAAGHAGSVFEWDGTTESLRAKFDGTENLNNFVAAGSAIYIASYGQVAECTVKGCVPLTTKTAGLANMTTDGKSVFWIAYETQELRACAVGVACPTPTTVLSAAQAKARPLFATVSRGTMYVTTEAGDIFACAPEHCAETLKPIAHEPRLYLSNEVIFGRSVVADDTAIYWTAIDGKGPLVDAGPDASPFEDTSSLSHRIMRLAK